MGLGLEQLDELLVQATQLAPSGVAAVEHLMNRVAAWGTCGCSLG